MKILILFLTLISVCFADDIKSVKSISASMTPCQAMEKSLGWKNQAPVDLAAVKTKMANIPSTVSFSPQSAVDFIMNMSSAANMTFNCLSNPENKEEAKIYFSYTTDQGDAQTPTIIIQSKNPEINVPKDMAPPTTTVTPLILH